MEEEQREAMFNAWKLKEDKKHKDCEPHRWSYAEPKHCVECGKRFELSDKQLLILYRVVCFFNCITTDECMKSSPYTDVRNYYKT